MLAAREFCFESPLVPVSGNVRAYAEPSFAAGTTRWSTPSPSLTERIFTDFAYDPGFTTVTTPLEEVLTFRRGVCQDFAHLAIGLPAVHGPGRPVRERVPRDRAPGRSRSV